MNPHVKYAPVSRRGGAQCKRFIATQSWQLRDAEGQAIRGPRRRWHSRGKTVARKLAGKSLESAPRAFKWTSDALVFPGNV